MAHATLPAKLIDIDVGHSFLLLDPEHAACVVESFPRDFGRAR